MGIPGLTRHMEPFSKFQQAKDLEGADVWVDGHNFVHFDQIKQKRWTRGDNTTFEQLFLESVGVLVDAKPHSITFYYDAYIPAEKIQVRVARKDKLIATMMPEELPLLADYSRELIRQEFPDDVKVVLCSGEAEDVICWHIQQSLPVERKQFILTSDSDVYTMELSDYTDIYMVSLFGRDQWPKRIKTYPLAETSKSSHVQDLLHPPTPPHLPDDPDTPWQSIKKHEILALKKVDNVQMSFLPTLPQVFLIALPSQLAEKYRAAAYTQFYKAENLETSGPITEYSQMGKKYLPRLIELLDDDEMERVIEEYESRSIVDLVMDELERACSIAKRPVSESLLKAARVYLDALVEGTAELERSAADMRTYDLVNIMKSILYSFHLLSKRDGDKKDQYNLLWRVQGTELEPIWKQERGS